MSSGMTTRVLALILAVAAGGCAVESTPNEPNTETQELGEPRLVGVAGGEGDESRLPTTPSTLYARSGDLDPGETQSGPFPEPWGPDHAGQSGSGGNGNGSDPNKKP
jgi:hypothetical protein